jgi:hypothetical protein
VLDVGSEVDPESSGVTAPAGEVAGLRPVVDDVGFDTEVGGDVGDAEFGGVSGLGVVVSVLVGGAGSALVAGGFDLGWEGAGPAVGGSAAGLEGAVVDPVVDGGDGHADPVGDLAWGEFSVGEQAGVGDVVVVAQVGGGDTVEGLAGAGAVSGLVERGGQGGVVQAGADAGGEGDRGGVGGA